MKALDVASVFVNCYGNAIKPTNLKVNKLAYYAQVESLRMRGCVLFDDEIEAWKYGPVVPSIYHAFKAFGRGVITSAPQAQDVTESDGCVIEYVANTYGKLTAFDLVSVSHRDGGAWRNVYSEHEDRVITDRDIVESIDYLGVSGIGGTLDAGIRGVINSIPNVLKMLENS
ncbi:Panacea domain-containing protein [Collinsella tanakaei]|uniref:Panacea domain-containing protein n=1 Tax=Collinsella tanakaei TaxID=626935 RepID=UPI00195A3617|nr:type II toxin-antitoxin system antitoxin SocA domain-containing protein [Collinsella tanakaei]MBM6868327.1 DUF4065 domain-containing protein [Collinsella tanakaei]